MNNQVEVDLVTNKQKEFEVSNKIQTEIKKCVEVVGNQNTYQIITVSFFCLALFFSTSMLTGTSFYFMNPVLECDGLNISEDKACLNPQNCIITNTYTITAENNLYCDRRNERNLIQLMFGIGSILGVLCINFISDFKGRKFSVILGMFCQILSLVFLLLGSSFDVIPLFFISQILAGFGTNSLLIVSFVFTDKLMSVKWAKRSILITNGFGSLFQMLLIIFCQYSNWRILALYVILIPQICLFIFGVWFLVEDPVLLYSKNKINQCQKSIAHIAKINKTENQLGQIYLILQNLQQSQTKLVETTKTLGQKLAYLKLLKDKRVILTILCLGLHALGGNFTYFALNFAISEVGNSYGFNMFLFGIVQFVGMFPLIYLGQKLPRKKSIIIFSGSVVIICSLFLLNLSALGQSIFVSLIKFILVSQYTIYIYLSVQSFPQHIQSTAFGCIQFISQFSKLLCPYSINIAESLQISPIIVIGITAIIFMFTPLFFIKETLKTKTIDIDEKQTQQSLLIQ